MKFFLPMKLKLLSLFFFLGIISLFSQTKVSGHVYDEMNVPVAYANVLFKGTTEGQKKSGKQVFPNFPKRKAQHNGRNTPSRSKAGG